MSLIGKISYKSKSLEIDIRDHSFSASAKNVFYDKPRSNVSNFDKLGISPDKFDITVWIFDEDRANLLDQIIKDSMSFGGSDSVKLTAPSPIIFRNCLVESYSIKRDNYRSYNKIEYKISFKEVPSRAKIAQVKDINYDEKKIIVVGDSNEAITSVSGNGASYDKVISSIKIPSTVTTKYFFEKSSSIISEIGNEFLDNAYKITNYGDNLSNLISDAENLIANANTLVNSPLELARNIKSAFKRIRGFDSNLRSLLLSIEDLLNFRINKNNTADKDVILNIDILNDLLITESVSCAMDIVLKNNYDNNFDLIDDNNKVVNLVNDAENDIVDKDILTSILDLSNEFNLSIEEKEAELPKVVEIDVRNTSLQQLLFLLYGSFEYENQIIALNQIEDYSRINGKIKVLKYA